ncbi:MAG: hypothetical protein IPK76_03065 [Lewinellaceae bacterium]|nr:hypothetical protein [Lewinellaceae bacterium]
MLFWAAILYPISEGAFPATGNSGTAGAVNHNLGGKGGEERHKLTIGEMPEHRHLVTITYREGTEQGSGNNYSDLGAPNNERTASQDYFTDWTGGDNDHNNMPPFLTVKFIIKAH